MRRDSRPKVLHFAGGVLETKLDDGQFPAGFRGRLRTGVNFLLPFTVRDGRVASELVVEGRFVWTQARLEAALASGSKFVLSRRFGFSRRVGDAAGSGAEPD